MEMEEQVEKHTDAAEVLASEKTVKSVREVSGEVTGAEVALRERSLMGGGVVKREALVSVGIPVGAGEEEVGGEVRRSVFQFLGATAMRAVVVVAAAVVVVGAEAQGARTLPFWEDSSCIGRPCPHGWCWR